MRTLTISRGNFDAVCYTAGGQYLLALYSRWRLRVWATADFSECYIGALPSKIHLDDRCRLSGDLAVTTYGVYSLAGVWAALRARHGIVRENQLIRTIELEGYPAWSRLYLAPDGQSVISLVYR